MDVALLINFFVIFNGLQNTFAQLPAGELHTNDGSNLCTVKLDTCRLKVKDYPLLERGEKGDLGLRGLPGPTGPPGTPGIPGTCQCKLTPKDTLFLNEGSEEDFKKEDNDKICSMAPRNLKSGNYTTGLPSGYFDIYCNMTTRETCIRKNLKTPTYNYSAENGTLWLSGVGINLRDIYGLNHQQISWLQSLSSSVRQTLKYHCFDSVPYPKFNTTPPVKLLTWNDIVIEPYPKTDSPFFYSVPPETDGCVEGSSTWNSTIIEIISTNANRLPIRDIWIGDVRGKNQKMYIENIEICFG